MHFQTVWKESTTAVWAGLKHFVVELVESILVVGLDLIHVVTSSLAAGELDLFKLLWRLWARSPLFWRLLHLFVLPFYLARFDVDVQTLGSEFSPADPANQRLRPHDHFVGGFSVFLLLLGRCSWLASFEMLRQTFWVEGSVTSWARDQHLFIIIIKSSLVVTLNVSVAASTYF